MARPADGAPVVLDEIAHLVWCLMDEWTTEPQVDAQLAERFPDVPADERIAGLRQALLTLDDDDLLDLD